MPTESAKMFLVGNEAGEDTSVKGGKRTRTGVPTGHEEIRGTKGQL